MRSRFRTSIVSPAVLILLGGLFLFSGTAGASPSPKQNLLTTPVSERPGTLPTVYPPAQADNGAQVYWGMCQDCHGDEGQGLDAEWRSTFAPASQDCWGAGCHGEDAPNNSFILAEAGAPALAGPGALPQFSTAFELGTYIYESMPYSPTGSLTEDQAWELTAYILHLNEKNNPELTLSGTNSAAIPVHQEVKLTDTELPGVLILSLFLIIGAVYISQLSRQTAPETKRGNFYHHLHPATIPEAQSKFNFTLGAGGLAIFFSLVLLITGALEMYYYLPTPDGAAESIQVLTGIIPFGNLIRNLHFWSAQLLVFTMMVHLVRIILTGAYAPPRRFNFILGLILLVLILLLDFTGYVLRWDEGIRWALVVGTNLLKTIPGIGEGLYQFVIGGPEPGAPTLIRFYAWHIFGLTLAVASITAWHIFRVRRDGGISAPPPERGEKAKRIPRSELLRKEVIAMIIAGVVLLLLSVLIPAPIDQPLVENGALVGDSRAPWFFLWIQETLQWGDPFLWGVALPLAAVILLGLLPYILPNAKKEEWGRWLPPGNRLGQIVGITIIVIIFLLTLLGWLR
jgi:quinol-cytochrome oxidoreductase complex cytochrome b subunit/mono/diheme cytochrome c family protein